MKRGKKNVHNYSNYTWSARLYILGIITYLGRSQTLSINPLKIPAEICI